MKRPLSTFLATAAAAAALAPAARAGEFVVTSCGESPAAETTGWTLSSPPPTLDAGTQCPPVLDQPGPAANDSRHTGIYLTDRLSSANTPGGTSVTAAFDAAPGTRITRARIWRYYRGFGDANWRSSAATLEGQVLDGCTPAPGEQGCGFGNPNYAPHPVDDGTTVLDLSGLSTAGIRYRLVCAAEAGSVCSNGATIYSASLSIFGTKMTIEDLGAPVQATPTGPLWDASGYQRGTLALTAAASDNSGIRATQLLVDDLVRAESPRPCNFSRPAPCSDEPGAALALDTTALADGPHTLTVRALDAAQNPASRTRPALLLVDNNAPEAPIALRIPDGASSRSNNAWTLEWNLPEDAGSPIVAARYSICPAGSTSSCTTARAEGPSIRRLPEFALPGPGTWDVRVWLEDETGQTDPARSSSATLTLQAPAGPPPTTTAPPTTSTSTSPPPPPITDTGSTPPPPLIKSSARLRLTRARRTSSTIAIAGTTSTLATGSIRVTYSQRIAGRTLRVSRTVRLTRGRFALRLRVTGRLARASRGTLTVSYAGNARVLSATVRRKLAR